MLLGRGDGTFAAPVAYETRRGAWQVVVGDFTRDGILDIATANRSTLILDDCFGLRGWDTVSILAGRGDGTFAPERSFSLGDQRGLDPEDTRFKSTVVSLNTNDINRDGFTDLIASHGAILFNAQPPTNGAAGVNAGVDQSVDSNETILYASGFDGDEDVLAWSWRDATGNEISRWPDACVTGLVEGPNVFTVIVSDLQGHEASDTVTVYRNETHAPDQQFIITNPVPGEIVTPEQAYQIRWAVPQHLRGWLVAVSYSTDGGRSFTGISDCALLGAENGICQWFPPSVSENVVVRVETVAEPRESGTSGVFSVRSVPHDLPWPWQHADIGAVGASGNASVAGSEDQRSVFTVDGSGADIWNAADEFHYVYQTGEQREIVARVDSVENVHRWTKAGVMVRAGLTADAPHVSMFVTPGKGIAFQRRTETGGTSLTTPGPLVTAPVWLRLLVRGDAVSGWYRFGAGDVWTFLGEATFPAATPPDTSGLAVTSHADGNLATAQFSNVAVNPERPAEYGFALIGTDVGSISVSTPRATITAQGRDIWNRSDEFAFMELASAPVDSVIAHVANLENTYPWAKAGIMVRASHAANAAHVMMVVTPERGISVQSRSSTGASSVINASAPGGAPAWLRLDGQGTLWTASILSAPGVWTPIGTVDLDTTAPPIVGLAVSSHDTSQATTAVFDDYRVVRSNP